MKSPQVFRLSSLILVTSLAACGGGGDAPAASAGGGVTVVQPNVPAGPTQPSGGGTTDSGVVTSVAATTYTAGSEELAAFTRLNAERSQCGFGLMAQAVQLDAAAKSHNDYQIINNLDSHFENQTQFPNGFTGVTAADRAVAKGYLDFGAVADEYAYLVGTNMKSGVGENGMRGLLSAPYHLSGLMDGYRDVGVSVRAGNETTPIGINPAVFLHVNASYKSAAGKQLTTANDIQTYPCQGSTGVNRRLSNESPNPVPGRDLQANPIGTPIYFATRGGDTVTIATASVRETATNTAVVLRTPITASNDPNSLYKANEGYVAPDAPLKALTQYTVTLTGTAKGIAFAKTFIFTTGM